MAIITDNIQKTFRPHTWAHAFVLLRNRRSSHKASKCSLPSFNSDIGSDMKLAKDMQLAADGLRECPMCANLFDDDVAFTCAGK